MDFWFALVCCLWASSLVPKKSNEEGEDEGSTARGQALPEASAVGWTCALAKLLQPVLYVYQGDSLSRISDILCKVITWKQSWGPLLQAPWHPHRASYRHFRNVCSLNLDTFRKAACEFNFNKLNHNFKKHMESTFKRIQYGINSPKEVLPDLSILQLEPGLSGLLKAECEGPPPRLTWEWRG